MTSYHLLLTGIFYEEEQYDRLAPQQKERQRQRALRDGVGRTDEATQSNVSWRERAGAMGGGTAARFR